MAGHLTYADTKKQSLQVFGQFGEKVWKPNAKFNSELPRKESKDLRNIGLGKFLVICATGESLEDNIDTLKKHRDEIDIMVCDKSFGLLMEQGIKADYCMICDANIPYRYIEKWIDKTDGVKLISTPYANTEWTKPWKGDRYFYVNKDSIQSEKIFLEIMGKNTRIIPASTNVSNAMVVFMCGYDENTRINFSGYEKIFLVGYDYSWRPKGKYYAYMDPIPKRHYMNHLILLDLNRDYVFTSQNLLFSAKWLYDYCYFHNPNVFNCSGRGILDIKKLGNLTEELNIVKDIKEKTKGIKNAYSILQSATLNYQQAQNNFERARRQLWQ